LAGQSKTIFKFLLLAIKLSFYKFATHLLL
jgi:hypothetical protein